MPAPGGAGPGFPLVSLYAAVKRRHKEDTAATHPYKRMRPLRGREADPDPGPPRPGFYPFPGLFGKPAPEPKDAENFSKDQEIF
jgi:hypothetical protein